MSDTPDLGPVKQLVYVGRRVQPDGKVAYVWSQIDDLSVNYYRAKPPKKQGAPHAYVGAVYAYQYDTAGTAYYTSGEVAPKYVKSFPDKDLVAKWQAQDRAAEVVLDREKRAEKAEEEASIRTLLAPLRELYANTNSRGRRALLAVILEAVTG